MAQFYSNETFPLPAVEELRNLDHNVVTSSGFTTRARYATRESLSAHLIPILPVKLEGSTNSSWLRAILAAGCYV